MPNSVIMGLRVTTAFSRVTSGKKAGLIGGDSMRSLYIKPLTMEPLWAYCSLQICERWQWDIEGGGGDYAGDAY